MVDLVKWSGGSARDLQDDLAAVEVCLLEAASSVTTRTNSIVELKGRLVDVRLSNGALKSLNLHERSEPFGEVVNLGATIHRLRTGLKRLLDEQIDNEGIVRVAACHPTTSTGGGADSDQECDLELEVGRELWVAEVSDTLKKNANRKILKDCQRLSKRTGAHRRWIISSGVNAEYRPVGFDLSQDGAADDYRRTVVRELNPSGTR